MSNSFTDLISGGNQALRLNMQRHIAGSIRAATFTLSEDEEAQGLVQLRMSDAVIQKGRIILRPGDEYYLVASPKFRGMFYVMAERQGQWMCSSDDFRVVALCQEAVRIALATTIQYAQQIVAARALVGKANQCEKHRWRLVVNLDEHHVALYARFAADLQATPSWHWSLADGDEFGVETLAEDVKEILYTHEAYTPQNQEEQACLEEKVAQAMSDDEMSA